MNRNYLKLIPALALILLVSCVSKKKFIALQDELASCNEQLGKSGMSLNDYMNRLQKCQADADANKSDLSHAMDKAKDLRSQLDDCKNQRDKQMTQVGDLTVLTKSANDNMKETLEQLAKKDQYIHLLQAAKSKADSLNLALAVNLKGQLAQGLDDQDVNINVDKTVVMINLSDKMLYTSGSANLSPKANEVLGKIAQIINARPDLEVMVEGYTDNVKIKNDCVKDNWDLSVKRATAVVRVLQTKYNIDPNRLIAAGRGEFNTLASNDTPEGRSTNRRTRIIILPKLNQFYDLLDPDKVPK
ncbi:MAG: OmpA family protein [Saprospiraceae bacterium]|uniref:OmpA family protein n=1 Tax=Candidatus Opimibacter skivensis TaxID=2982028 RepID=A0A9D7XPH9_9BACT|nr:OmpA family protein [Candidatus Opimibacter skivensis]